MTGADRTPAFSRATAEARIAAVLDAGQRAVVERAGQVLTARGTLDGRAVRVAASDPSIARGAIGTQEAEALSGLLQDARARREPVLWLLDSAGANVEQGLAALGAFRRLFRAALWARLADVPMLALLGRSCFGGASMLACLCHTRIHLAETRLATSGPGVIEDARGKDEFDASDPHAVVGLMGSASRIALHPEDCVREDTLAAAHAAAVRWLRGEMPRPTVAERHACLAARLEAPGAALDPAAHPASASTLHQSSVSALLPPGYQPALCGSVFRALPAQHSGRALFLGALGGTPIGARECWVLADWLLAAEDTHAASPIVLVLDAQGHAANVPDERVLLSDYLVHLSLVIADLTARKRRVVLWIPGAASGASYVAFAAGVDRVSALPGARIAVLPSRAVQQILGAQPQTGSDDWFETGVADALLDPQHAGYDDTTGTAA